MSNKPKFAGWRIAIFVALTQTFGIGVLQAFSPMINPIATDMGVDPGTIGGGMAIFVLTLTITCAVIGSKVDKGSPRKFILIGSVLMFIGMVSISFAQELWQMGVMLAVGSVGIAMCGPLPMMTIIVRWFKEKRGTAMAIATTGGAGAGFFLPSVSANLIESVGWRTAAMGIGGVSAIITFLIALFFIVDHPHKLGQFADGANKDPVEEKEEKDDGSFVKTKDFWLFAIGSSLILSIASGVGVYMVPALEELGVSADKAALVVTVGAIAGFLGTVSCGAIADKISLKMIVTIVLILEIVAVSTFYVSPSYVTGLIAGAAMGFVPGAMAPIFPLMVSVRFGSNSVASVTGIQGLVGTPFLAGGSIIAGSIRNTTGEYSSLFFYTPILVFVAMMFLMAFRLNPVENKKLSEA